MRLLALIPLLSSGLGAAAHAYTGPGTHASAAANQETYAKYCVGTAASASVPKVNWKNPDVIKAAGILSTQIACRSYYFYSGPQNAYGLMGPDKILVKAPADAPAGTTNFANAFLTILCGEFRDRASMIAAKIDWVNRIYKLPIADQAPYTSSKSVWAQMSAKTYRPYLDFSAALFAAKAQPAAPKISIGSYSADAPIAPQSVCETKYIFSEYLTKSPAKTFPGWAAYQAGYNAFKSKCASTDEDYVYDFRGDSNFKPNSPESNGMIWKSNSIASQCLTPTAIKPVSKPDITNADCEAYFKAPFRNRWNAARAGLAAWLLRDKKHDATFANSKMLVVVNPDKELATKPYGFSFAKGAAPIRELLTGVAWNNLGLGFNTITKENPTLRYERLRDAVNRHTDWYQAGWDDLMGMWNKQAYSPFVASSYEMSKSDAFVSPGYTVGGRTDHRKHWMFIFKVKKTNWYNSKSVAAKTDLNFDRNWFDETSLGTVPLAKSERAFDRLGTPLESELDSILYLHNITDQGALSSDAKTLGEHPSSYSCDP